MRGPAAGQEAAVGGLWPAMAATAARCRAGGHRPAPAAGTLPLPDLALARGVGVEGEVFELGLAPLGEGAQPGEELVHDAAEPAADDERVEHGGDRVRRCV